MNSADGDRLLRPGDIVAEDCEVVAGSATVDQSAITGESAPVLREARPGHQTLLAGCRIQSGELRVRPLPPPPARPGPLVSRVPRWWPAPTLAAAVALALLSTRWHGVGRALALAALLPPYLLLLGSGTGVAIQDAFWRRHRTVPLGNAAFWRAANCDTLVLPNAAVWEDGSLSAVEFWPVLGVTVREVATAARQANLGDEDGPGRSVVILAKQRAGLRGEANVRTPLCGPVRWVARQVAEYGGAWPEEAQAREREILARGGRCLGVADGGRPLGLVELRAAASTVTLDDVMLAGIALVDVEDPAQVEQAVAQLRSHGRRVAVALETGMRAAAPAAARFVLAGPAWAASRPTVLDLDAHPGKLPAVLLGARRLRRHCLALSTAGSIADGVRALAAGLQAAATLYGVAAHLPVAPSILAWVSVPTVSLALAVGVVRPSRRQAPSGPRGPDGGPGSP